MNPDVDLSYKNIDGLLQFLPVFESNGFVFGDWSRSDTGDPGVLSLPQFEFCRAANDFLQCLYDDGWVIPFDWTAWTRQGQRYVDSPPALQHARLTTIRKLLTLHARKERFCEGHLAAMFECGHLTAILRRIKQIAGQQHGSEAAGEPAKRRDASVPKTSGADDGRPTRPDGVETMAIYHLAADRIEAIPATTFSHAGIKEREDLQRLLRDRIEIVSPGTLIVAEEFGDWEESRRRIDLLGIDRDANLIVIELKRTEDGGHMELQAIRYAAMISTLTFEQIVSSFDKYLKGRDRLEDARDTLLEFLDWDEPNEDQFAQDVRIVLASAEFSKELTTAVMWLNERQIDVRCVRLKPHQDGDRLLLDVQQVIPLPEAEDYQIKVREKARREKQARDQQRDTSRFSATIQGRKDQNLTKGRLVYHIVSGMLANGVTPEQIAEAVSTRATNFCWIVTAECRTREEFCETAERTPDPRQFDAGRYFADTEDLIRQSGRTIAVARGWGPGVTRWLGELREAFPEFEIEFEVTQAVDPAH